MQYNTNFRVCTTSIVSYHGLKFRMVHTANQFMDFKIKSKVCIKRAFFVNSYRIDRAHSLNILYHGIKATIEMVRNTDGMVFDLTCRSLNFFVDVIGKVFAAVQSAQAVGEHLTWLLKPHSLFKDDY